VRIRRLPWSNSSGVDRGGFLWNTYRECSFGVTNELDQNLLTPVEGFKGKPVPLRHDDIWGNRDKTLQMSGHLQKW
jgi:hypothetical protein